LEIPDLLLASFYFSAYDKRRWAFSPALWRHK